MRRVTLKLPYTALENVNRYQDALAADAGAFSFYRAGPGDLEPLILEWVFETAPAQEFKAGLTTLADACGIDLEQAQWSQEDLPNDHDWLSASYTQFPPFSIGPFYIHGSHVTPNVPPGSIDLCIDAATAFGSGEHGTTRGCLEMLSALKDQGVCPWNVLDMGTGSGILAIAAWKLWKTPVLAADNDPECLRVTDVHARLNHVPVRAGDLGLECGDGFAAPAVQQKKPFDLIIANILAGTLIEMAADLRACCDQNAYVILSGILERQAGDVIAAYAAQGFSLRRDCLHEGWRTLLLQQAP